MKTRPELSVLWREGAFLAPHHFQAFARELGARIHQGDAAGEVGSYGWIELSIDEEQLERDIFCLRQGTVVFKDGTVASFPDTAIVEQREFAEHFVGRELQVYLGVPSPQPNVPQIASGGDRVARYAVESAAVHDENARDSEREVEFRQLHGRFFFGDEDRTGYECLPIAKLVRAGRPEMRSMLSPDYVPPVMALKASPVLLQGLTEVADRARAEARDLASRLPAAESYANMEKGADVTGLLKLAAANRASGALAQFVGMLELHPLHAYLGLVEATSDLATFSAERVVPELPVYDHDQLGACFEKALDAARSALSAQITVPYDTVPFRDDPEREGILVSDIPAEWCKPTNVFYLGVELAKTPEEAEDAIKHSVKLVPEADVNRVLENVRPGIDLTYTRIAPGSFPKKPGLHYFRVESEGASRDPWVRLLDDRTAVLISALGIFEEVRFSFYVELKA